MTGVAVANEPGTIVIGQPDCQFDDDGSEAQKIAVRHSSFSCETWASPTTPTATGCMSRLDWSGAALRSLFLQIDGPVERGRSTSPQ